MKLHLGDCLEVMKTMEDNSVDSIVTDPPYGLSAARNSGKSSKGGFMGKKWDYDVPSVEIWREALRVLKPGGHLLAFSGTRTYHRMVVNIEDAGFEIRDQIQWIYGEGFPKSLNISKAIDKNAGVEGEIIGDYPNDRPNSHGKNMTPVGSAGLGQGTKMRALVTPEAKEWEGWGTQLKPANEPICLARKPLIGTVVENVLEHGTGGLNIDGCRIGTEIIEAGRKGRGECVSNSFGKKLIGDEGSTSVGRFPSNVIMDEVAGAILDEQAPSVGNMMNATDGLGGASRFFYCAKTSQAERNVGFDEKRNNHPTVKPLSLMTYLCRLVTPPHGTVLDPFMGSGSTGIAACMENFDFIGIDMEEEYVEIARHRIAHWSNYNLDDLEVGKETDFKPVRFRNQPATYW